MKINHLGSIIVAILLSFIAFTALSIFSIYIHLDILRLVLLMLPLIIGILLTLALYPNYKKSVKSAIDIGLYFPASIVAITYILNSYYGFSSENIGKVIIKNPFGFVYAYFLSILTVMKCCFAYWDTVLSYHDEKNILIEKSRSLKASNALKESQVKNESSIAKKDYNLTTTDHLLLISIAVIYIFHEKKK